MAEETFGPVTSNERIDLLDVLRGLAVGGILLGNLQWFSGYGLMPPVLVEQTSTIDHAVRFLIHFFVEGKFYSIFSFLFGFGFAIQMARSAERGDTKASLFKRRLFWLLIIGITHAVFLWYGDILTLYALLGFVLLRFRKTSDTRLLKWAGVMIAVPVIAYLAFSALFVAFVPPEASAAIEGGPTIMWKTAAQIVPTGSYTEIFSGFNLQLLAGRWASLIIQMRLPKVFAMFLLGVYAYRRGFLQDPSEHHPFIRRVMFWGLGLGIVGNAVFAHFANSEADFPPTVAGFIGVASYSVAVPAMALGIAALITTLWQKVTWQRLLSILAPVGRMALTNYLMHTVVCLTIFYGYGFGQFGRFGAVRATLIGIAIFAVQIVVSSFWLRAFRFGPMEWLWRRLTYRRALPWQR
ncbi:DUF418 domain-containing protein [soil metagenome]